MVHVNGAIQVCNNRIFIQIVYIVSHYICVDMGVYNVHIGKNNFFNVYNDL